MATTNSYDTAAVERVIQAKIPIFLKGFNDATLRNRTLFPLLKKWGRVMFNAPLSTNRVWNAKVDLPITTEWPDSPNHDFPAGPPQKQYSLDAGSYRTADSLSEQQKNRLEGPGSIYDAHAQIAKDVQQSHQNRLNYDGWHGTGSGTSMTGFDGLLGAGTVVVATDIVAEPTATYAGQSTEPGVEGTWTDTVGVTAPSAAVGTDWPGNVLDGSSLYDWNSPLKLVRNSPLWNEGADWKDNCTELLRYWHSTQKQRGGQVMNSGAPITFAMGRESMVDLKTYLEARNYRHEPVSESLRMGMPQGGFWFDDCYVNTDSDIADDVTYCIQADMLEFYSKYGQLWDLKFTSFHPEHRDLWDAVSHGNFRFGSAKYFGDIKDY
jgi:hypothetical protein